MEVNNGWQDNIWPVNSKIIKLSLERDVNLTNNIKKKKHSSRMLLLILSAVKR